jgi:hypothetical protein
MNAIVFKHLKETVIIDRYIDGVIDPITVEMFQESDIEEILEEGGFYRIRFSGINGTVPLGFFDDGAKRLIIKVYRKRLSPLWRALNDRS